MSLLRSSSARTPRNPTPRALFREADVPPDTPLPRTLALLAEGVVGIPAAKAALLASQPARLELDGVAVDETQAEVLEDYLSSNRCRAVEVSLKSIDFATPSAFTRVCNGIARNKNLEKVTVTGSRLSDDQAEELVSAINLGHSPVCVLDLSSNSLGSPTRFIERLKRLADLQKLNLSHNRIICVDTLASALAGSWSAMTDLAMRNTGLSDEERDTLVEAAAAGSRRFSEFGGKRRVVI